DQSGHRPGSGQIGGQGVDLDAMRGAQLRGERLQPLGATRDQPEVQAVAGQPACQRLADAARRTGDERDLPCHPRSSARRAITSPHPLTPRPRPGHQNPAMPNLPAPEFPHAAQAMVDHFGLERLRDRFASLGAFKSRRGLNTPAALADRLYHLSGGLRRQAVPSFVFTSLWSEMLSAKLGEDGEKRLEEIAEKENASIGKGEANVEGAGGGSEN